MLNPFALVINKTKKLTCTFYRYFYNQYYFSLMMMRSIFFSLLLASCFSVLAQTTAKKTAITPKETGYSIPITLTPFKNTWVYLGCYYGKYKNLSDSVFLNANSQGVFKGKNKLPQGIYFVVSPAKYLLFELLMDKDQHFTIKADTTNLAQCNHYRFGR